MSLNIFTNQYFTVNTTWLFYWLFFPYLIKYNLRYRVKYKKYNKMTLYHFTKWLIHYTKHFGLAFRLNASIAEFLLLTHNFNLNASLVLLLIINIIIYLFIYYIKWSINLMQVAFLKLKKSVHDKSRPSTTKMKLKTT